MNPIALWVFVTSLALAGPHATIADVLQANGSYAVSDGSSVYTFRADHTFELNPQGVSGRTVRGVWADDDGKMRITGQWSWVNGASPPGDYREMLLYVSPHGKESATVGRHDVYPAYLLVEALNPVDEAVFEQRRAAVGLEE